MCKVGLHHATKCYTHGLQETITMFIGKKFDIIPSEITPRGVFENRREFIKTAGAGLIAGAAAASGLWPTSS